MNTEQKKYFEDLIGKNKIADAIEELIQLNLQPNFNSELIQIKNRFEELKRKKRVGTISAENERLEYSQITDSLLSLIGEIWSSKKRIIYKIKRLPDWIKIIGLIGSIASIIGLIITIQAYCYQIEPEPSPVKKGCTNPKSCNFDSLALEDDGSCKPIPLCNTDPCKGIVQELRESKCDCISLENQPKCKQDETKETDIVLQNNMESQVIEGCTDSKACNYNPKATKDNNNCKPLPICNNDPCKGHITKLDQNDKCKCIIVKKQLIGCSEPEADNYNKKANCDDGSCIILMKGMVVNKENISIPNVRIEIENIVTETDKDGRFKLELPFYQLAHRTQVTVYYSIKAINNNIITRKGNKNIIIEI